MSPEKEQPKTTWTATGLIPTLSIPDLASGLRFYERLGFETEWQWPDPDPSHAGLNLGKTSIMLAECDPGVMGDLYFLVDDVAACFRDIIQGKSWELVPELGALAASKSGPPKRALIAPEPPQDQPYGLRDFHVIDPWGHSITFGESLVPE